MHSCFHPNDDERHPVQIYGAPRSELIKHRMYFIFRTERLSKFAFASMKGKSDTFF